MLVFGITGREAALWGMQVVEVLSLTMIIVALPTIGTDLALTTGQLQLVVSPYAMLYGALLWTARRGDGRDPILSWSVLTDCTFAQIDGVACMTIATTSDSDTLVALVTQDLLELGPPATGLVVLPFSAMVVVDSAFDEWWLECPLAVGMAAELGLVAVAMVAFAGATPARSVPLLAVAVAGLRLPWVVVTSTQAATAVLPPAQLGTASGAVNTAAQVETVVGGGAPEVDGYVTAVSVAGATVVAGPVAAIPLRTSTRHP